MTQFNKSVPINVTGGSYQDRSRPLSSQQTKNFYPQIVEQGKEQFVLHSFHGLKRFGIADFTGRDRGSRYALGAIYRVVGEKLYSVSNSGVHTLIGTISGASRCIMSDDGTNLIIVAGGAVYKYDGATLSTVTDSNIVGATAVTFINNQMVYTVNNLFVVADVGQPDVASGLNAAAAESQPDDLVRAYAFQQNVYMFGERSTEVWYNSGVGNPPFTRIEGQIFEIGLGAINSVAHTDEAMYWLGDDNAIYQASGATKRRVSTSAISHWLDGYSDLSDAYGYTFTVEGLNFYLITFPSQDRTFCLNESLGDKGWFELSSGTNGGKYQGASLVKAYNDNFVSDYDNGRIYKLDYATFTNNLETIQRRRTTGSINGKLLGRPGNRVQMSRLELIMETGDTLVSGQGDNARIQFEVSYDGGKSWVTKGWGVVGRLGQNTIRVEMFNLDSFYDCIVRLTTSDPIMYSIYSATADLRLAGR